MSLGNTFENLLLKWMLTVDAVTRPTGWKVSLHTADPGETGASEIAGNNYARVTAAYGVTDNVGANTGAVVFSNTSAVNWAQATHFGVWDTEGTPRFIGGGQLPTAKTIEAGDTGTFAIGALTITQD